MLRICGVFVVLLFRYIPSTTWISCPLAIRLVAVFPMLHSTQICSHSTFSESQYQADSVAHHKTECITAVGGPDATFSTFSVLYTATG